VENLWIAESAGAALCQALRYAALKELNKYLSTLVATYVRLFFSFPLQIPYVAIVLLWTGAPLPSLNARFLIFAALTAVGQFLSTAMTIRLFQMGNFAVGTMLTKSDVVMTALIGTAVFGEVISGPGWIAIFVTALGVLIVSAGRMPAAAWRQADGGLLDVIAGRATRWGLAAGIVNALSYQFLRETMLALDPGTLPVVRAAVAGFAMTLFSVVILGAWLLVTEREGLKRIPQHQSAGWLLGFLSALGTILWYLATTNANASYVAAVAQVQVVFSLLLSRYWFGETIKPLELLGIAAILVGVLIFRLV
jgi:drug/metabolite transporter (DMT)-like permease